MCLISPLVRFFSITCDTSLESDMDLVRGVWYPCLQDFLVSDMDLVIWYFYLWFCFNMYMRKLHSNCDIIRSFHRTLLYNHKQFLRTLCSPWNCEFIGMDFAAFMTYLIFKNTFKFTYCQGHFDICHLIKTLNILKSWKSNTSKYAYFWINYKILSYPCFLNFI